MKGKAWFLLLGDEKEASCYRKFTKHGKNVPIEKIPDVCPPEEVLIVECVEKQILC